MTLALIIFAVRMHLPLYHLCYLVVFNWIRNVMARKVFKTYGPVQCNLCSKTFARNFNLRRHVALVHPELDPSGAMLQATCDKLESDLAFATSEHSRKVSELETRIHWLQTKVVALSIERDLIWEHANVDVQDAPLD